MTEDYEQERLDRSVLQFLSHAGASSDALVARAIPEFEGDPVAARLVLERLARNGRVVDVTTYADAEKMWLATEAPRG